MKKYLKTALIACLAVCMIACTAVFATACTDTGKYEITLVYADDNSPAKGVMVNFCEVGGSCVPQATDENGKVTEVKAEIKDGYAVFTTMQFGTFVISEQIATVPVGLIVAVSIGAVVAAGLIVACVLVFLKKKRGEQ